MVGEGLLTALEQNEYKRPVGCEELAWGGGRGQLRHRFFCYAQPMCPLPSCTAGSLAGTSQSNTGNKDRVPAFRELVGEMRI